MGTEVDSALMNRGRLFHHPSYCAYNHRLRSRHTGGYFIGSSLFEISHAGATLRGWSGSIVRSTSLWPRSNLEIDILELQEYRHQEEAQAIGVKPRAIAYPRISSLIWYY
ncbi:hypothetical protein KGM_215267 [Danaus plexippus plexippus]|uniref:Uncharacterized protein n=1 Tax=Danaus plexippus plexippus TaxID=278856 RepID=A0A212F8A6_DANPL|nr:hypothetical protein KGM_215267 [Danaus plexippus plexippus]